MTGLKAMTVISASVMGVKPSFTKLSMRSFLSILNLRPLKNFTANPRGQIIFRAESKFQQRGL